MEFISTIHSSAQASSKQLVPLFQMLNSVQPLSEGLQKYIAGLMKPCKLAKGKNLLKPGEVCTHIVFISSGVLRGYLKDGDSDITTWITTENQMAAAISSFVFQAPAIEYVQAIEDCKLLALSYTDLEKIYVKYPSFNVVARKIYEQYYADAENRALITRLKNADMKYQHFIEKQNHLANRIPIMYIASYLGIASETLSRLRGKKAAAARKPGNNGKMKSLK